jgi:hypothetical protein
MIFGYQLLALLFEKLNEHLKLGLDHEMQILIDLTNQMAAKDMQENTP